MAEKTSSRKRGEWNYNPTFFQWLRTKMGDRSNLGVVARWVVGDAAGERPCWPHRANTITHLVVHLRSVHGYDPAAPPEVDLRKAFEAYRAFMAEDGKIPLQRGGIIPPKLPKDQVRQHRGYLIQRQTVKQIRDLAKWRGITQGQVIETLVGDAHQRG